MGIVINMSSKKSIKVLTLSEESGLL